MIATSAIVVRSDRMLASVAPQFNLSLDAYDLCSEELQSKLRVVREAIKDAEDKRYDTLQHTLQHTLLASCSVLLAPCSLLLATRSVSIHCMRRSLIYAASTIYDRSCVNSL